MAVSTDLVSIDDPARSRELEVASSRDRDRSFRKARRHTLLVKALRLGLPLCVIGLMVLYGVLLKLSLGWNGVVLPTPPRFDTQNLTMDNPRYEGFNKDGGRFVVVAKTAVQDIKDRKAPVQLTEIDGDLVQADKTLTKLKARRGTFDSASNELELFDGIDVVSQSGLKAQLSRATILTKEGTISSREPVAVQMSTGTVNAKRMVIAQKSKQVAFWDDVVTRLIPEQKPGAQPKAAQPGNRGIGNANTPIDITSSRLDVDDTAKTALFTGRVRAVQRTEQGESTLESEELLAVYEGKAMAPTGGKQAEPAAADPAATSAAKSETSKLKRISSTKPTVLTQGQDRVSSNAAEFDAQAETATLTGNVVMVALPDRRATSDRADIDQLADTILLTGAVHVVQGKNELKGRRLWVDRKNGKSLLSSPASPGQPAGRIAARFYQAEGKDGAAKRAEKQAAEPVSALGMASFKTDPTAPMDIESDTLDVNDMAKTAVFRGDVRAVQGEFKVRTVEMTAFYSGQAGLGLSQPAQPATTTETAAKAQSQLTRIEARKKVIVTSKEGQTATGDWADFDVKANTVVLGGDVVLTQGQNIIRGTKLVIDMTSGETRLFNDVSSAQPPSNGKGGAQGAAKIADPVNKGSAPTAKSSVGDAQAPFTPGMTGRPRMVIYPQQLKEAVKQAKDPTNLGAAAATAAGAIRAEPGGTAVPAAGATPQEARRPRSVEPSPSSPRSVFGPTQSN